MTFEVQYDSILSRELHVLVHDATDMPVIINDPMITEMHQVEQASLPNMGLMGAMGGADLSSEGLVGFGNEHNFTVTPSEVQGSDWIWETSKGQIRFSGIVNKQFAPFEMDFWLR